MASEDVIPYNNLTLKPLFIEPVRTIVQYHSMVPDGTVPTRLALRSGAEARSTRSVDALCRCARERATARGRALRWRTHTRGGWERGEARRSLSAWTEIGASEIRSRRRATAPRRTVLRRAAPRPGNANGGTSGKETAPSRRNDHFEHSAHAETTVRWGLHIGSPQKQRVVPTTRGHRNRNGARRAGGRGRWAAGRLCATARAQRPCAAPGNPPRDRSGSGLCPPPARVAAAAHGEMNAPRERALKGKARIASRLDPARTRMGARRAAPMC